MRILEICPFSSGICGVWTRVKQEALELSKEGNEVFVFSSNIVKGSNEIAKDFETIEDVKVRRFPVYFRFGENAAFWNFYREALIIKPDVIIAHVYRHPHTNQALKVAMQLKKRGKNVKIFLVTHAPFVEPKLRSIKMRFMANLYDIIYSGKLKEFKKVIAITNWEMPFLKELGVKKDKIEYIPNGIPEEFFKVKKGKEENKILFFGRISPIKDIETLIKAFYLIRDKEIKLELAGPAEKDYLGKLKKLIKELGLEKRVFFSGAVYGLNDKIKKIDSAKLFVLPSKREAMPQALIEVMAREKIVVASNNLGAKDIIRDGKNGFLFEIGNENQLSALIDKLLQIKNEKVKKEARKSVEQFSWNKIIGKIRKVIEK